MKSRHFKIKNLHIGTPLILAPMCDVTRAPYRLLCREFGAGLTFSEKLDEAKFRLDRCKFDDFIEEERPVGAQIIGNNAEHLKSLIEAVESKVDVIDFNAGCSKRRYITRKWGGWFSGHPKELETLLSNIRASTNLPFTVKVRLGKNRENPEIFEILRACENTGVDAITIHARFVIHNYLDAADWSYVKKIKEISNIPVIANGDIFSAKDALRAFEETGCDAVMIGRGAMGNPLIFSDTNAALGDREYPFSHSLKTRLLAFSQFLKHYKKYATKKNFAEIKAHATWFVVSAPGTRKLRVKIQNAKDEKELLDILNNSK